MKFIYCALIFLFTLTDSGNAVENKPVTAESIILRYIDATGGLDAIKSLKTVDMDVQMENHDYQYHQSLHVDGRFRVEKNDRIQGFDGKEYWEFFHGLAGKMPVDHVNEVKDLTFQNILFSNIFDKDWNPRDMKYLGMKEQFDVQHYLLGSNPTEQMEIVYYFNVITGFLDKAVFTSKNSEGDELTTIFRYSHYQEIDNLKLLTHAEGTCITTGELVQPAVNYKHIKLNQIKAQNVFEKPESTITSTQIEGTTISAKVIFIDKNGNLVTNITREVLQKLGLTTGGRLKLKINGQEFVHVFYDSLSDTLEINEGDLLATFNGTPALWFISAYMGMTSILSIDQNDAVIVDVIKN
ncbi:hypothetical protein JW979_05195 [bacterium]|nr:hypothetical protein [candidate division CSSED10-310 bacterium]